MCIFSNSNKYLISIYTRKQVQSNFCTISRLLITDHRDKEKYDRYQCKKNMIDTNVKRKRERNPITPPSSKNYLESTSKDRLLNRDNNILYKNSQFHSPYRSVSTFQYPDTKPHAKTQMSQIFLSNPPIRIPAQTPPNPKQNKMGGKRDNVFMQIENQEIK